MTSEWELTLLLYRDGSGDVLRDAPNCISSTPLMTRLCELPTEERSELAESKAVGLGKGPNYIEEDLTAVPSTLMPPFD